MMQIMLHNKNTDRMVNKLINETMIIYVFQN